MKWEDYSVCNTDIIIVISIIIIISFIIIVITVLSLS